MIARMLCSINKMVFSFLYSTIDEFCQVYDSDIHSCRRFSSNNSSGSAASARDPPCAGLRGQAGALKTALSAIPNKFNNEVPFPLPLLLSDRAGEGQYSIHYISLQRAFRSIFEAQLNCKDTQFLESSAHTLLKNQILFQTGYPLPLK
jgi:hypothetical protein